MWTEWHEDRLNRANFTQKMNEKRTNDPSELKYLIGHYARAIRGLQSMIILQEYYMRLEPEYMQDDRMLSCQNYRNLIREYKERIMFLLYQLDDYDQNDVQEIWKINDLLTNSNI